MKKNESTPDDWYIIENVDAISSPALLVYPDRIRKNILKMIEVAGNPGRLRPHVKTYKMAEIVMMQISCGIEKFKCATIAEAEMVANCGSKDILLAYQPVGPNQQRLINLKKLFPGTTFSFIADSADIIMQMSAAASKAGTSFPVWLDINNGMNRTGIKPEEEAYNLCQLIVRLPGLSFAGLHVYDGHIRNREFEKRKRESDLAFENVSRFRERLLRSGIPSVSIIGGGTPTFPVHALREDVDLSPGTLLLWDYGYSSSFTDMEFSYAAILLARVISKPGKDLICIDLGHKAVASEMPQPRISIIGLDNYEITGHNEEHMVIRTPEAERYKPGDVLYSIPYHICPTVDRYETVSVVQNGKAVEEWHVAARKRKITL